MAHDDLDDTATESYRLEQGRAARPSPAGRMGAVPISFGGDGAGGIVGPGPVPPDDGPTPATEAEANQRAVERGARALEREADG